ncbi:hypothetical protein BGW38_001364, partial [Lunasporangiospora selenospora]
MKVATLLSLSAVAIASFSGVTHGAAVVECNTPGTVALTIDDGPGGHVDKLLAVLTKNNVKATFYLIGSNVDKLKNDVKRVHDAGHMLASHTFSHDNLDKLDEAGVRLEIQKASDSIFNAAGVRPAHIRAPEGACSEACTKIMDSLGLVVAYWNLDTNDWRHAEKSISPQAKAALSFEPITKEMEKADPAKNSYVLLQHELEEYSIDPLIQNIIDAAHKRGFKFVTMDQCTGKAAYFGGSSPDP